MKQRIGISALLIALISTLSAQSNVWNSFGNVGIGTTTPGAKLEIAVPANGADGLQISRPSSPTWQLMNYGPFYIQEAGIGPRFVIAPGGNVGVGTSSPNASLEIYRWGGGTFLELNDNFAGGNAYAINPAITGVNNAGFEIRDLTHGIDRFVIDPNGNVGIGTTVPVNALDVKSSGASAAIGLLTGSQAADALRLMNADGSLRISNGTATNLLNLVGGNVGIGTSSPNIAQAGNGRFVSVLGTGSVPSAADGRIDLANPNTGSGYSAGTINFELANNSGDARIAYIFGVSEGTGGPNGFGGALIFATKADNVSSAAARMYISNSGNVGIGTTNPTQKLSVNGTIRAKEVVVETTGWSDYVFADNYVLQPLAEVEAQIKQEKHLPGIPSAQQVAERGIGLGEMQAKLLSKIEELTLHMIELEKENKALKMRVTSLETR